MKATIPYVEKKFEEFNLQMFAGKLPKLPIELSDAKTFLGKCVYKKRRLPNGDIENYDFKLKINTRIDLPESEVEDTIIHEMIHYFIDFYQMKDSSSHGHLFRHMMEDFNNRFGRHITISHKSTAEQREQAYDKRQHYHVVAVVSFSDGKLGVKVLPRIIQRIVKYYNVVNNDKKVVGIQLYMSNDIYFNRFPNSSAFTVRFVNIQELMPHLQDAEKLGCDGKTILRNQ